MKNINFKDDDYQNRYYDDFSPDIMSLVAESDNRWLDGSETDILDEYYADLLNDDLDDEV